MNKIDGYSKLAKQKAKHAPRGYFINEKRRLEEQLAAMPKKIERLKERIDVIDECLDIYENHPDETMEGIYCARLKREGLIE